MRWLVPSCRLRQDHLGGGTPIVMCLLALLLARPAFAHGGDLTVESGSTLTATFTVGSPPNGSASSALVGASAGNIEVNFPPQRITFGLEPFDHIFGLRMSMADVSFTDPSVGSFDLTGRKLDLLTPGGFGDAPLAADGSFALADHELRIDQGKLTGTLVGFGPIHRDFTNDPLTLIQLGDLTGIAIGDTNNDGSSFLSFDIPFDHQGSPVGSGGVLDVGIQGRLVADGVIGAIPEPSIASLLAGGFAVLGARRRSRS